MKKIRAIVKRPDEKYGHVTHVSNTLEKMKNKESKEADLTMLAYAALEAIRKDLYEDQKAKKKASA